MAERKPLFQGSEGFSEEMAIADTATFGGLTLSGDIAMAGNEVTGLPASPSGDTAAASKAYVDSVAAGLNPKESVTVRAQGDVTIATPGATIDGVTMAIDERFLADQQTTTTEDGIYLWKGAAVPAVRSADAPVGEAFAGVHVFIHEGTDADKGYLCTNDSPTDLVGTHDLVFVVFTGAGSIPDATSGSGGALKGKVTADSDKGLLISSGILEVKIDAVTIDFSTGSLSVTGIPLNYEIGGVAVGNDVTAANMDTLTDGSNADALHIHSGSVATEAPRVENTYTTATDTTANGDPVYFNGSNTIGKSLSNDDAKARVIGVIRTGGGVAPVAVEVVSIGPAAGVIAGATFNTPYYLQAAGGLGTAIPGAGNRVIQCGKAINTTDLFVQIIDYGKKAA